MLKYKNLLATALVALAGCAMFGLTPALYGCSAAPNSTPAPVIGIERLEASYAAATSMLMACELSGHCDATVMAGMRDVQLLASGALDRARAATAVGDPDEADLALAAASAALAELQEVVARLGTGTR